MQNAWSQYPHRFTKVIVSYTTKECEISAGILVNIIDMGIKIIKYFHNLTVPKKNPKYKLYLQKCLL